ncbi:MAG: hypothetical protein QM767_30000 [Anaeromyxobacter sp.]
MPELKLERVRFRVWRGADLRLRGAAQAMTLRRDSSELAATNLAAELPRGDAPILITAPTGTGVMAQRDFEVHGGVTITQAANVARTAAARFQPVPGTGQMQVIGTDPVIVTGPAYQLEGTGFALDAASGDFQMQGPVQLHIRAAEAR